MGETQSIKETPTGKIGSEDGDFAIVDPTVAYRQRSEGSSVLHHATETLAVFCGAMEHGPVEIKTAVVHAIPY